MEILDKTGVSVLWSAIKDKFTLKSSLSKVATSGSYNDLSNKPAIPSAAGYLPLSGGTMTGALKIKGTAANKPLTVRGIVGCLEDGVTYDELHLQYGANAAIKLGNTAAYSISADGSQYTGNAATATTASAVAWANVTGKPTMPTNITATAATIVSISGSTIKVNASLDNYKTPGEYNIYGTSNGDYAKMYVLSGIADTFNGTRVITLTIRVTISHSTYAEVCDVTRQYKSNAWSAWTIMYLGND